MKQNYHVYLVIWLLMIGACREKYDAGIVAPTTGYLVVEGYINSGPGEATTIMLSRTAKLTDSTKIVYERNAQVSIQGEKGSSFALAETGIGVYTSAPLNLDAGDRYRLRIITHNGKEYLSDYSAMLSTPIIDSLNWIRDNKGVDIYVNTHDDQHKIKYYRWSTEQTWEFHSVSDWSVKFYVNRFGTLDSVNFFNVWTGGKDSSIYKCWKTVVSPEMLLGSTEKLTKDIMYQSLAHIPDAGWELSVLYSILVKQYAVSREHYDYLQRMKRNTEKLGSIFDAQPSDAQGNIHCTTDAGEPVVGYMEVSQERQKRIFISNAQVPGWNYQSGCVEKEAENKLDIMADMRAKGFVPTNATEAGIGAIIPYLVVYKTLMAPAECVDCTLRGVNVKPGFWP